MILPDTDQVKIKLEKKLIIKESPNPVSIRTLNGFDMSAHVLIACYISRIFLISLSPQFSGDLPHRCYEISFFVFYLFINTHGSCFMRKNKPEEILLRYNLRESFPKKFGYFNAFSYKKPHFYWLTENCLMVIAL